MSLLVSIINGKAPSGGSGGVSDADLTNLGANFFQSGYVAATDLQVQPQGTPNNTVKVKAGKYYAKNAAGTILYMVTVTADFTPITISNNPSGNPLVGSVVLKIDTVTTPDATASNIASFLYVAGTAAASPSAPSDSDLQSAVGGSNVFARLADIDVVAGFTSAMAIDGSKIHDKRTIAGLIGSKLQSSATNPITAPIVSAPPVLATGTQETGQAVATGYGGASGMTVRYWVPFKTVMQNTPSNVTLSSPSYNNCNSLSLSDVSKYGFRVILVTTAANAQWDCAFTYATVGN